MPGAEVRNPLGLPPTRRMRQGKKSDSAICQENLHLCPTTFEAKHFQRHSDPITEKGNGIRSHGMYFVYIRSCDDQDVSPTSHFDLFSRLNNFQPSIQAQKCFLSLLHCLLVCALVQSPDSVILKASTLETEEPIISILPRQLPSALSVPLSAHAPLRSPQF